MGEAPIRAPGHPSVPARIRMLARVSRHGADSRHPVVRASRGRAPPGRAQVARSVPAPGGGAHAAALGTRMNAERWRRIKELHAGGLDLAPEERRAYLESACGGDGELLAELLQLFALDDVPGLEPPELAAVARAARPHRLGDFELLEELGRGGMGVVYRARQVSLEREVAVKLLPRTAALAEREVERFRREALAAAKLRHPRIVPIHIVGCDQGVHYFAMDCIHGRSLAEEIELLRRPAGEREQPAPILPAFDSSAYIPGCARLIASVAEALEHAHGQGVVHRDVKPSNVLLDRDGQPHVVDFGLAKIEQL